MAPRAYCKGRLKLSLVFCTTKLHPATWSERVRFPRRITNIADVLRRGLQAEAGQRAAPRTRAARRSPRGRSLAVRSAAWRLMNLAQSRHLPCVTARWQAI